MSNFLKCKYDYVDTDSVKQALNAQYGKEVQMRNEFIVLHENERPAIVRKSAIMYVAKQVDNETACVNINGCLHYVDEQYNEVVRRLFK